MEKPVQPQWFTNAQAGTTSGQATEPAEPAANTKSVEDRLTEVEETLIHYGLQKQVKTV